MDVVDFLKSRGLMVADYEGGSNANLFPTLISLLNDSRSDYPLPLLRQSYTDWIVSPIEQIVLLILDGLGYEMLRKYMDLRPDSVFSQVVRDGRFMKMTSVTPSTTVSAMASIWNGMAPSQHSLAGYEMFVKELGTIVNMLRASPTFSGEQHLLEKSGVKLEDFFDINGVQKDAAERGVKIHSVLNRFILDSPLSRLIYGSSANKTGIINFQDEMYVVNEIIEKETPPFIVGAYWSALDSLSHHYGVKHEVWRMEMDCISRVFEHMLLKIPSSIRGKTLFVITADHGFCCSPPNKSVNLLDYPEIMETLVMPPSGESRFTYLFVRPHRFNDAFAMLENVLGTDFVVLKSVEAYEAGLFGPRDSATFLSRIGDIIVTPTEDRNLVWNKDPHDNMLIGRHGGMTSREMIVPFLTFVP